MDAENRGKWKLFFDLELKVFGGKTVLTGNLNTNDSKNILQSKDSFISEVLKIWAEINFKDRIISENHFLNQSLQYNSLIRIDTRPVYYYPEWNCAGITMVKHLKDDSNNFLSLTELQTRYGITVCPLKYCGTLSTIKLLWKTHQNSFVPNDPKGDYESFSTKLRKGQKANKLVYTKLLSRKIVPPRQAQQKWVTECGIEDEECIKWHDTYQLAFKCCTSTRLLEFQFKVLHR